HPNQIRTLFAIILTACSPSSPAKLWEKYKSYMAEDILHRIRSENSNMNMDFTAEIYNEALIMIEDLCLQIANKVLNQLGMPSRIDLLLLRLMQDCIASKITTLLIFRHMWNQIFLNLRFSSKAFTIE
ncbi:unnamed protein product, partial [Onchocerca ochengi]